MISIATKVFVVKSSLSDFIVKSFRVFGFLDFGF
jgi:hypothetical protein